MLYVLKILPVSMDDISILIKIVQVENSIAEMLPSRASYARLCAASKSVRIRFPLINELIGKKYIGGESFGFKFITIIP